ncbi:Ras guanine nucleotide exchange factor L, partial [Lachnellula cervina]
MTINTQTHHPITTKPKPKPDPESNQVLKIEKGTTKIKISSGTLTTFPLPILTPFDTLTHLDLSNNPSLSTLPASISRLHKLKIAFFSSCAFTTFPAQLAQCRSLEMIAFKSNAMTCIPENAFPRKLRWLILTDNRLEALPESIGRCAGLQKCMLAGNRLRGLPDGMRACRKLGLLRLSGNLMEGVPGWVLGLPELSYLSFAGNPCSSRGSNSGGGNGVDKAMLDEIAWEDLEIQHVLGEGASGVISKGIWKHFPSPSPSPSTSTSEQEKAPEVDIDVAVKVFKGALTSDGSPLDEMHATITAGKHPNLIDPLGRITGKTGLVLQLIPPTYTNLGLPPSLDSCTRDSFPADTVF